LAISGASAVFRGIRPAPLPTATTRDRGRLSLIATIRREVPGVPRSSALDVAPKTRSSWNTRAFSRPGDSRASSARPAAARTAAADHYLARVGPTHRRAHDVQCDDGKELESSIDFRNGRRCAIRGAINETYGFFTRGPVIGGESVSLRASAVINQTAVLFTMPVA